MAQVIGDEALESIWCDFLVALPLNSQSELLYFSEQAQSEMITAEVPFVAIGSGQAIALPFLAFVKRVMWNDSAPTKIGDGIFGVLWTLQHVIKVNAGLGVGGEPTIAILQQKHNCWESEVLDSNSLEEHIPAIRATESALQKYRNVFNPNLNSKE